jgi:ABC-type multidrug transport system fused ATPase/permease subunit
VVSEGKMTDARENVGNNSSNGIERPKAINIVATAEAKKLSKEELKEIRASRWKVLWRLLAFARPEYLKIALGLVGLSINAVTNLSFPWLIGKALDQASIEDLSSFLLKNAYFFLAGTFASWLRIYCLGSAAESIGNRLRMEIFDSFLQQDMHFYESLEMGEVATLLENDVNMSAELFTEKLGGFLRSLNSSINGSIALYSTSPKLCSITLSIVPVVGIAAMTLSRYSRTLANKFRDQQSKILSYSIERIRCISTVRLNHKEQFEHHKFNGLLKDANSLALNRFNVHGGFMSFVNLFTNMSLIAILRTGGGLVSQGQLSVGSLTSFAIQSGFVGLGFSGLSTFYSDFIKGLDATSRIFRIIDLKMDVKHKPMSQHQYTRPRNASTSSAPPTPVTMRDSLGEEEGIRLRDVSFHYQSRADIAVLNRINLHFQPRQISVIVGKSGSGKSTLAALLCGLYRPSEGEVSYFGSIVLTPNEGEQFDSAQSAQCAVFDWCGAVEQSGTTLLAGTIRENICYGYHDQQGAEGEKIVAVSQEEIERAAKAANAHDFIMSFPTGYDTEIGSGGCLLSGGQRARIALARALVKAPKYLVLDEPTSALDPESEQAVMEPLRVLKETTTIIIFTHSEALQRIADVVYTLNDGKLIRKQ